MIRVVDSVSWWMGRLTGGSVLWGTVMVDQLSVIRLVDSVS